MRRSRIWGYLSILLALLMAACSVHKSDPEVLPKGEELVFAGEPEPAAAKADVYVSMARAAKYNADVASHSLRKKIYNQNPNLKPEDIIQNVLNSNISEADQLYNLSRVLEFAITYAVVNLADNPPYADSHLYNRSAQHLALAAIKSHQDSWWGERNMRDIDRMMRAQQKIIKTLAAKDDRSGLSPDEIHYKKNLEVAVLKLGELQKALLFNRAEYGQLTKTPARDIRLEGRKFYQLEDFDKKYNLEIFQEAAVRNRSEFALAKEKVKNYEFDEVRAKVIREYPLIERLDINGFDVEDEIYYQALQERVLKIANNLVEAVMEYRRAEKSAPEARALLRRRAFDNLGAAILTQVDINYQLVKKADVDYENIRKEINQQVKEIRLLKARRQANYDQKLELLNAEIKLLESERQAAQILAERAVALRGLYFNAGLSPFSKKVLKAPVKDIAKLLKHSFNQDVVEMLAAASKPVRRVSGPVSNDWAKESDWLEKLMQKPAAAVRQPAARPAGKSAVSKGAAGEMYGPEAASYKTLQLGAYEEKFNAMQEWDRISGKYPALKKYNPGLERYKNGEEVLFRLVIQDGSGQLYLLCNQLRAGGEDCLLR